MTNAEAAESGTVEDPKAAAEAAVSSKDDRDWEGEARELGWIPEDEFKAARKPGRFKTAQEFVEDIPPYVKKLLDRQEAKFNERVAKVEKLNAKTVEKIVSIHNQELTQARADKREAVKAGDVDLVEKLDAEIDKLKNDAPLTDDPKAKKDEAEKAFGDANPWYGSNRKMTAFARGLSQDLASTNPDLSYEDNIKAVLVAVHEEFPEYFDKTRAGNNNSHASVDGGSENPGTSRSDPFAKLTAVERSKANEDMKAFPKVYPTKASWVAAYEAK